MLYSLAGVGQMQAQESSCTLVLSGHVIDDHDKLALFARPQRFIDDPES